MSFIHKIVSSVFGGGGGKDLHPTQTCPECGSKLRAQNGSEQWQCPNPDCPAQVRQWLAHWCAPEVMDVPGADARLIALLVERGAVADLQVADVLRGRVHRELVGGAVERLVGLEHGERDVEGDEVLLEAPAVLAHVDGAGEPLRV